VYVVHFFLSIYSLSVDARSIYDLPPLTVTYSYNSPFHFQMNLKTCVGGKQTECYLHSD